MIPGWKDEIEGEYLQVLQESPGASPSEIATRLGVSEGSAVYWLTEMAREGRVRIRAIELVQDGQVPSVGGNRVGSRG